MINPFGYQIQREEDEIFFRCEMNHRQFKSLEYHLVNSDIENEILNNKYYLNKLKNRTRSSLEEIEMWLKNSWNTEKILIENISVIENTGLSFAIQWAFPQAYYSVFGSILAMYKAIGFTETSHTSVLKKYGSLMEEGKLPEAIAIYCNGIKKDIQFHNIEKPEGIENHMALDFNDYNTINNHICQFLKSTRLARLKEKAPAMKFKTKAGTPRKSLRDEHWQIVSKSIGNTTFVDFLYRKRIKGNYQDIEIYNSPLFKGEEVLNSLCQIVSRINLVNETYTAQIIGLDKYREMSSRHLQRVLENGNLENRISKVENIIENS